MDKGSGGRTRRILSWILAALIITGGAIAIGWFAGIALVNLMEPGSKDLAEQMDELNGQVAEAAEPQTEQVSQEDEGSQEPQVSLPSIMDEAFEGQEDGASPFASPPWANNVSITPIEEGGGDAAEAVAGQEPSTAGAQVDPIQQQPQQADGQQAQAPQVSQAVEVEPAQEPPSQPETASVQSQPAQQTSQQVMYKVRVGPYPEKAAADEASARLKEMGLPVLTVKDGTSYFVQVGAFSVWANADSLVQKVKASGFSAKIAN